MERVPWTARKPPPARRPTPPGVGLNPAIFSRGPPEAVPLSRNQGGGHGAYNAKPKGKRPVSFTGYFPFGALFSTPHDEFVKGSRVEISDRREEILPGP